MMNRRHISTGYLAAYAVAAIRVIFYPFLQFPLNYLASALLLDDMVKPIYSTLSRVLHMVYLKDASFRLALYLY